MSEPTKKPVIEIQRDFNVSAQTLFETWTQTKHLCAWWQPMGETVTDVTNDIRIGGTVTYYIGKEGLEVTGVYSEVVPNQKLVYTWIWNMNDEGSTDGYTLDIRFEPLAENHTRLHVLQKGFSSGDFLPPHQQGWDAGLDSLAKYLANSRKAN